MAIFFSALLLSLSFLLSNRFSFESLYVPPVRGEGILGGLKVGEEKGVWVLDSWTGRVRFCHYQGGKQGIVCSSWRGGSFISDFEQAKSEAPAN